MKKFFSLLAIIAIILASNCTEIPENNDPILGKWLNTSIQSVKDKGNVEVTQEWIFNDVNLGRYHRYENNELVVLTDFGWSKTQETYTISYSALDVEPVSVIMGMEENEEKLQLLNGIIFALRD